MKTLEQAVKQAEKLLINRNKLNNCKPWKGLYIVPCNDTECYRSGSHYHTATQKELDTHYSGIQAVEFVSI